MAKAPVVPLAASHRPRWSSTVLCGHPSVSHVALRCVKGHVSEDAAVGAQAKRDARGNDLKDNGADLAMPRHPQPPDWLCELAGRDFKDAQALILHAASILHLWPNASRRSYQRLFPPVLPWSAGSLMACISGCASTGGGNAAGFWPPRSPTKGGDGAARRRALATPPGFGASFQSGTGTCLWLPTLMELHAFSVPLVGRGAPLSPGTSSSHAAAQRARGQVCGGVGCFDANSHALRARPRLVAQPSHPCCRSAAQQDG